MNVRTEKLLRVDAVFSIEGRGVVVTPKIPLTQIREGETQMFVLLRRPDGIESRVLARFSMPHVSHPDDMGFLCLLPSLTKEDVPVGSEILKFVHTEKHA
jgi:hypothetical protein